MANETSQRDAIGGYTLLATDDTTGEIRLVKVDASGHLITTGGGAGGSVTVTNFPATGTWAYYAGSSGTCTVTAGQKVIGIAAHATTAGSFTINGGASVPVPANSSIEIQPNGQLVAPTIIFSGTDSYFVEVVS